MARTDNISCLAWRQAFASCQRNGKPCPRCMRLWFSMNAHTRQLALDVFQNNIPLRDPGALDGQHYAIQELAFYLYHEFCEDWLAASFPSTYGL